MFRKKQIRYFGIYKVDPKTLKSVKDKSVIPSTRNKLILRLSKLKGIINRNKGRYEKARESNPNKDNYYLEWKKADKELIQVTNKLRKMEKKDQSKATPKSDLTKEMKRYKALEKQYKKNQKENKKILNKEYGGNLYTDNMEGLEQQAEMVAEDENPHQINRLSKQQEMRELLSIHKNNPGKHLDILNEFSNLGKQKSKVRKGELDIIGGSFKIPVGFDLQDQLRQEVNQYDYYPRKQSTIELREDFKNYESKQGRGMKKEVKSKKMVKKKVAKKSSWIDHVKNYMKNYNVSYKQALKDARPSYYK